MYCLSHHRDNFSYLMGVSVLEVIIIIIITIIIIIIIVIILLLLLLLLSLLLFKSFVKFNDLHITIQ